MIPRDRHAIRLPSHPGRDRLLRPKRVTVVGGGIAGLAAAAILSEHGATVHLIEREDRLGGRVGAWQLDENRTMSRGFHAFFRQYYNLRSLLARTDPGLDRLVPVGDYPLLRRDGVVDSFASIPRTPPFSLAGFVLSSPTFPLRGLTEVDLKAALELIDVDFPATYARYGGESAEAFLDRLRFPHGARHLALEVFARSFFARPADFSAGELIAMFHTYFTGSAEGLLFDVPDDDYDTALWAPLGRHLAEAGVAIETGTEVTGLRRSKRRSSAHGWIVETTRGAVDSDAVVLAVDPRGLRGLVAGFAGSRDSCPAGAGPSGAGPAGASPAGAGPSESGSSESGSSESGSSESGSAASITAEEEDRWLEDVVSQTNAPPFAVLRLWLGGQVHADRPAFLGTTGYRLLDNVSVLERFEAGAERWRCTHGGSVVELHAYALDGDAVGLDTKGRLNRAEVTAGLVDDLHEVYPETAAIPIVESELLIEDDCGLADTRPWSRRVGVATPFPGLVLAGDAIRCDSPVALMERAATTGFMAANELLAGWRVRGTDIWSPPRRGLLQRGLLRRGLIGALRRRSPR